MATAWRKPVGPSFDFAPERRQSFLGTPVSLVGQRAGLDVVGQREEVQEVLGTGRPARAPSPSNAGTC